MHSFVHLCEEYLVSSSGCDVINFLHSCAMVLCFGFKMRMMLITHQCFGLVLIKSRSFQLLALPWQWRARGAQGAGRGHSQDSWPSLAKEVSHNHWVSCQAIRAGRRKEEGRMFGVMALVFVTVAAHVEPCCPGSGWMPSCWWKVVNKFLTVLCFYWGFCSCTSTWFSPHSTQGQYVSIHEVLICLMV